MSTRSPRFASVVLATILLVAAAVMVPTAASAAGTTYYVNSATTSCSDTSAGTSSATPWCSLGAASRTYVPGDQLLIARGSTYTAQQLTITGQGTLLNRITVGTYGSGARPLLSGGTSSARAGKTLVLLRNPSFVTVTGLELTSSGAGVLAQYRSSFPGNVLGNQSIEFTDLVVSSISGIGSSTVNWGPSASDCSSNNLDLWQSGGVAVSGDYYQSVPATSFFVSGVTFRDIEGHNNLNVVNVDTCDGQVGPPGSPNNARPQLVRSVTVDNVSAYDGDGAGYTQLCNEGMRFDGITGLRVVNSRMFRLGACHVDGGTAAIILVAVTGATFSNNIISDVPATGSADQTGVDHEIYVDSVSMQNNLIARNAGPGIEYLSLRCGISDYNTNHVVTGNSFYGNGSSMHRIDSCPSAGTPFSVTVANNLVGDGTFAQDAAVASQLGSNNVTVAPGQIPHYSADEFQSRQGFAGWTYETSTNGTTWASATFADSQHLSGVWSSGGTTGSIAAFEQTAGTCASCATARVWTAPFAGAVSIRSLPMKSELGGASAVVRILKNSSVVAGPVNLAASNISGTALDASVSVASGDTLRFEVAGPSSSNTDWVSWAPSVAFSSVVPNSADGSVADLGFESPALAAGTYAYAPAAPWSFSPNSPTPGVPGAGITSNGSAFGAAAAPQGTQVGFIQGQGSASQTVGGLTPGGRYAVSFAVARRYAQPQTVQVLIDGTVLGTAAPTSSAFSTFTSPEFTATAGNHVITLRGTATVDYTAFIDQVVVQSLDVVPTNAGFETPSFTNTFGYSPTGGTWSFTASAGIEGTGSAFGAPATTYGTQAAFLQGQSTISQNVPGFVTGQGYAVVFSGVQRPGNLQTIEVLVDGVVRGTVTPGASWEVWASAPFTTGTGSHDIAFRSTVAGDVTAFIDQVSIVKAAATAFSGASFESPALASGGYQYGDPVGSWAAQPLLSHGGSGISANGSPFSSTSLDGAQVAFVQRSAALFSTAPLSSGVYLITFGTVQRSSPLGSQQLRVQVNGVPLASFAPSSSWTDRTVLTSIPAGVGGQLEFVGTIAGTDSTAFVDNIRVTKLG